MDGAGLHVVEIGRARAAVSVGTGADTPEIDAVLSDRRGAHDQDNVRVTAGVAVGI